MSQPIGYLYLTRNDVNDFVYVGQSTDMAARKVESYFGSGDYLVEAIREHGRNRFTKVVLGYFNSQVDLDYAEILKIAEQRASGVSLYNGGIGGPRDETPFLLSMLRVFAVSPRNFQEWFESVRDQEEMVKQLLSEVTEPEPDEFYLRFEAQLRVTQDLRANCTKCGSEAGAVCRTKTDRPTKNHKARVVALRDLGPRGMGHPLPPSLEVDAEQLRRIRDWAGVDDVRPAVAVVEAGDPGVETPNST